MSAYQPDQERAVRLMHHVHDWRESQLISHEQYQRMAADLETGLRRTNIFLRGTLFLFGVVITVAAAGLVGILLDVADSFLWLLFAIAAAGCFAGASFLVANYRLYRFGIEEALAVASMLFAGLGAGFLFDPMRGITGNTAMGLGFIAASAAAFVVFNRFGFAYAAMAGIAFAALAPFQLVDHDIVRRTIAAAVLAVMFLAARLERGKHGDEFPGDTYGLIETAAWGGLYLMLNLKASSWLSHPVETGPFYWTTYALIWMLPAAGLWIAIRERHRYLLDLNILLAIATLMSNKPYLNAQPNPWDPIAFGILLIGIALGVRRWLESGDGGARNGIVAFRLLASERDRLAAAGSVSVLQPSPHPQHAPEQPKPSFGGGGSGGAGTSGKF